MTVHPAGEALKPFDLLDRGEPVESYAECLAPALPGAVVRRELDALAWGPGQLRVPVVRQNEGPGNALMATLSHEHVCDLFTQFGEKGASSEQVAQALAEEVRAYQASRAALGPQLADQWALPLALAVWKRGGEAAYTSTELTEHATTNFQMIERFLPVRFEVTEIEGGWRVAVSTS